MHQNLEEEICNWVCVCVLFGYLFVGLLLDCWGKSYCMVKKWKLIHSHICSVTLRGSLITNKPHVHVFGLLKESREPEQIPHTCCDAAGPSCCMLKGQALGFCKASGGNAYCNRSDSFRFIFFKAYVERNVIVCWWKEIIAPTNCLMFML